MKKKQKNTIMKKKLSTLTLYLAFAHTTCLHKQENLTSLEILGIGTKHTYLYIFRTTFFLNKNLDWIYVHTVFCFNQCDMQSLWYIWLHGKVIYLLLGISNTYTITLIPNQIKIKLRSNSKRKVIYAYIN